jgi:hypothetical protein
MYRKSILVLAALLCSVALFGQTFTGGVKGTVVSRADKSPIPNAQLTLFQGAVQIAQTQTSSDGKFLVSNLDNGMYMLVVNATEFLETQVNVTVNDGYVKDMFNISLSPVQKVTEVDDASFSEFDMDDSGYQDNPTILFGSNDVFNNIAGYNFSAVRFRTRGYSSESENVALAGIKMNDALTGYSPYSLWSGLNEAMRSKDSSMGAEVSDYGFGGYNGFTNFMGNAASVRPGYRYSVLTNSALYRLRLMATYASGQLDNGWAYAFNVSARLGGNDWIQGVYYRSFAYYAAIDKKINDVHKLGFIFFAAPGQRGAQNASTQEVYDLMGDNMYNSNWGYQDGKVRNARVHKTHEPVAVLKYDFTPSGKFQASAAVLFRFGKNGYTALDWYDASDPRPDYYRNLPSYYYVENTDYDRQNYSKYMWAQDAWTQNIASTTHINWDRLYTVNKQSAGGRSKYVEQERRTDQRDLNFAATAKWRASDLFTLNGGVNAKINRTENFEVLDDLLGGQYYLNVDQFAERDYASSDAKSQNDLDYFIANGAAKQLQKGDKYGYDYYAQVRNAALWLNGTFSKGNLSANLAGEIGYTGFWRDGLVRKGLFPGLDENGKEYTYKGEVLTSYDDAGNVITSKGKSEKSSFLTYSGKVGLNYVFGGNSRIYADLAYLNDAPTFTQAFVSPRTRNTLVPDLTTVKTFTTDLNYQFTGGGYNLRVTGYYTKIMDQSDVMSFYDDLQNSFTNFALRGIDERHIGLEMGFKVPTPVQNLSVQGVLSWGNFVYTSNPRMTQTVDNSASVTIDDEVVPYWKSHPVYNADGTLDHIQKHYVASTPQLASSLGLSYNYNYWFIDADVDYFGKSYLEMNPLYRTDMATAGPDGTVTPAEIEYMTAQEKFGDAVLVNASVGKSWYVKGNQLGFSLQVKNITNQKNVKTGGYEQTRLVDNTVSSERYYRFDPKYFYMSGINYMLNLYFRF